MKEQHRFPEIGGDNGIIVMKIMAIIKLTEFLCTLVGINPFNPTPMPGAGHCSFVFF